jgi:hypothetical protein
LAHVAVWRLMETAIPIMKIATKVGHDQFRHDPRITSDFHYVSVKRDMADTSVVARFSVKCNGSGRASFSCLAPWVLGLWDCRLHWRRPLVAWLWCRAQFFFSFAAKKKFHCRLSAHLTCNGSGRASFSFLAGLNMRLPVLTTARQRAVKTGSIIALATVAEAECNIYELKTGQYRKFRGNWISNTRFLSKNITFCTTNIHWNKL